MTLIALALVAAAAPALPPERSFWVPTLEGQRAVSAQLVSTGEHLAVYRAIDERTAVTTDALEATIHAFDGTIYPRLVEALGQPPDRDHNGHILLLVTDAIAAPAVFFRFDALDATDAAALGLHSNEGEVVYHSFAFSGSRAIWNRRALARTFAELLAFARDPEETDWNRLLGTYGSFLAGLSSPRLLWGDEDPSGESHRSSDPWGSRGWSLLLLQYLRERLPDLIPGELARAPEVGFDGLEAVVRRNVPGLTAPDMLADAAMAAWLDDPGLAEGRFAFTSVVPPRAPELATLAASRPASGQVEVGVGGIAYLLVEGSGAPSLPLSLQGQPGLRWIARAVRRRPLGGNQEIPVAFQEDGSAQVSLPVLAGDESVILAVMPIPEGVATFDRRSVVLRWGMGWIPNPPEVHRDAPFDDALARLIPAADVVTRRITTTIERLGGIQASRGMRPIGSRFAFAPDAAVVSELLAGEAEERALAVDLLAFRAGTAPGLEQEWEDVLIELPGSDPRRWPIVLAAHTDAARADLDDSYLRALALNDNASGAAVLLEAAAAIAHTQHRAPIIVAFLSGGEQRALGARALLDHLEGHVAAWIELDGVGVPERAPRPRNVSFAGGDALPQVQAVLATALRRAGLSPRRVDRLDPDHSGASLAADRGIAALALRTFVFPPGAPEAELAPVVEEPYLSPPLMALLARAMADTAVELAGRE